MMTAFSYIIGLTKRIIVEVPIIFILVVKYSYWTRNYMYMSCSLVIIISVRVYTVLFKYKLYIDYRDWTKEENKKLEEAIKIYGYNWGMGEL